MWWSSWGGSSRSVRPASRTRGGSAPRLEEDRDESRPPSATGRARSRSFGCSSDFAVDVVDPVPSRPSSRQGGSSNRVGVDALELARRLRVTADEAESNFGGDRDSKAGKAAAAVDDAPGGGYPSRTPVEDGSFASGSSASGSPASTHAAGWESPKIPAQPGVAHQKKLPPVPKVLEGRKSLRKSSPLSREGSANDLASLRRTNSWNDVKSLAVEGGGG